MLNINTYSVHPCAYWNYNKGLKSNWYTFSLKYLYLIKILYSNYCTSLQLIHLMNIICNVNVYYAYYVLARYSNKNTSYKLWGIFNAIKKEIEQQEWNIKTSKDSSTKMSLLRPGLFATYIFDQKKKKYAYTKAWYWIIEQQLFVLQYLDSDPLDHTNFSYSPCFM